jgi:CRISPR-associated Csx2 family protein
VVSTDTALILLTQRAKSSNWDRNITHRKVRKGDKEEEEYFGLQTCIDSLNLPFCPKELSIPDGKDENEMWQIFSCLFAEINENDELYIDITHSFRYLPMLLLVFCNYSKFLKHTSVKSISYGNYEECEDGIAPIVDLTSLLKLQQYATMASDYSNFGRVSTIGASMDIHSQSMKKLSTSISRLDGFITSNRMNEIKNGKCIQSIFSNLKNAKKQNLSEPFIQVLEKLENELIDIGFIPEDSLDNVKAAIEWAIRYKMIPQAYTMGQEYIITLVAEKLSSRNPFNDLENPKKNSKHFREFISSLLSISDVDLKAQDFRPPLKGYEELVEELVKIDWIANLRENYAQLSENRNVVDHGKASDKDLEKEFIKYYRPCLEIIQSNHSIRLQC